MAAELVNAATSDKLNEMDWTKNIQICELVARDQRAAKDAIKAIKKRLGDKTPTSQLYAIMLLEMLMNNVGEYIHKQVIESGILPILVKIAKTKTDFSIQERIFHLLDATQSSLGGASGNFPRYFSAYQDLMSLGIQFPQQHQSAPSDPSVIQVNGSAPSASTFQAEKNIMSSQEEASARGNRLPHQPEVQCIPESSIIQKARNALEVLKEVMTTVDGQQTQHSLGAKDEFTLDLVEQCSFQKQRVMHLVLTSRDDNVVSQAIELNEQLQKVLERHDALLSARTGTSAHLTDCKPEEEEEAQQLFRRIRRGRACARFENEENSKQRHTLELSESSNSDQSSVRGIVYETSKPTRKADKNNVSNQEVAFASGNGLSQQPKVQCIPESSIIQKARNALEVLRDVLDNADGQQTQHPLGANNEFTLDLVEQCSFQKQRVMHLVLTSRDEKTVSQAIELNEQLQNLLDRYDALLSGQTGMAASNVDCEADEEEEPQQLVRRLRKGKNYVRPEDEESSMRSHTLDLLEQTNSRKQVNRQLKQPACTEPSESNGQLLPVAIPPPPAKHVEREKFFKENKLAGAAMAGQMRCLSLQNVDGSSSHSGNSNCSDKK
ncbi:TOM1-like protein 5 isoform X1 [Rhodamnia argentea]|uniref:TOM1-like protein 5 isoform X1 n=1 Tax=Rhodamnia argentea TaxID=178133 RepID=A0A8B8QSR7_9MYRT|nr:TOM1-like protein 5 isoform X1 [Rhodamnia argentea]